MIGRRPSGKAAPAPAVYIWLILGLPYSLYLAGLGRRVQREALRNLSEAMEQSRSAVMIVNLESRIEYVNAGLCQQIGYSRRELIGRNWREFQQPETKPEILAEMVAIGPLRPFLARRLVQPAQKRRGVFGVRGDIRPPCKDRGRPGAVI